MPTLLMGDFIANGFSQEDPNISSMDTYLPHQIYQILEQWQKEYPEGQWTTNNIACLKWAEIEGWEIKFMMPDGSHKLPEEILEEAYMSHFSMVDLVLTGKLPGFPEK